MARETPSHLVAPAPHKSKEDVAHLFSEKLGSPRTADIEQTIVVGVHGPREVHLVLLEKWGCCSQNRAID